MRLFIGALVLFMLFINEIKTASDNWHYPNSLGDPSQGYTAKIMTQNGQIQQQGTSGQLKRRPTKEERRVIAAKMAEVRRIHKLKINERSALLQPQAQGGFYDHEIAHFQENAKYKETLKLLDKYYPHGLPDPKARSLVPSEKPHSASHEKDDKFIAMKNFGQKTQETASNNWHYPTSFGHSFQSYMPRIMTQNGQIQLQGTSGQLKRRPTTEERKVIAAKLAEAKGIYKLKINERSALFQPQVQGGFYDHTIAHFEDKANYKETLKLLYKYYPGGLPDPTTRSFVLSEKPPPASHEKDDRFTAGGNRKYFKKEQQNGEEQKVVPDFHVQSSQQSQSPKHPYSDFEPSLIYNHNIVNPYLENHSSGSGPQH